MQAAWPLPGYTSSITIIITTMVIELLVMVYLCTGYPIPMSDTMGSPCTTRVELIYRKQNFIRQVSKILLVMTRVSTHSQTNVLFLNESASSILALESLPAETNGVETRTVWHISHLKTVSANGRVANDVHNFGTPQKDCGFSEMGC